MSFLRTVSSAHERPQGTAYLRTAQLPPRGIMYSSVHAASAAPHLLFSARLPLIPEFTGKHRIGEGYVKLLPAIGISDAELAAYDVSPRDLIALVCDRAKRFVG